MNKRIIKVTNRNARPKKQAPACYDPQILITGQWLLSAGFTAGDIVEISLDNGALIIRKPTPAPASQLDAIRAEYQRLGISTAPRQERSNL